jgi:hypothetical protein
MEDWSLNPDKGRHVSHHHHHHHRCRYHHIMTACGGYTLPHPNYSNTSPASDEAARARSRSFISIMQ